MQGSRGKREEIGADLKSKILVSRRIAAPPKNTGGCPSGDGLEGKSPPAAAAAPWEDPHGVTCSCQEEEGRLGAGPQRWSGCLANSLPPLSLPLAPSHRVFQGLLGLHHHAHPGMGWFWGDRAAPPERSPPCRGTCTHPPAPHASIAPRRGRRRRYALPPWRDNPYPTGRRGRQTTPRGASLPGRLWLC